MEEIEDYYTWYVIIMKLPDELFWKSEIRFLDRIVENKAAYEGWLAYATRKESERYGK